MRARVLLLTITSAWAASAAPEPTIAADPAMVTHLFTDWSKVDPGNAVFPIDLARVKPGDRELLDKVYDYYKVTLRLAERAAPPERVQTPHGVRVRPERAAKLGPWLDADRPWETASATVGTVLQEGGRYRLWYGCAWAGSDKAVVAPDGRWKLGSDAAGGGICYA